MGGAARSPFFRTEGARELKSRGDTSRLLESFVPSLPSVFLVSDVELSEEADAEEPAVNVLRAAGAKCVRCWNYRTSVGDNPDYPGICDRCLVQVESGLE